MSEVKLMGNLMAKAAIVLGLAGASVALYAESSDKVVRVRVEQQEIAVACAQSASQAIAEKYERCLEIFDGEGEEMIANTYCKPLAVAQACTSKTVSMAH